MVKMTKCSLNVPGHRESVNQNCLYVLTYCVFGFLFHGVTAQALSSIYLHKVDFA